MTRHAPVVIAGAGRVGVTAASLLGPALTELAAQFLVEASP
jgi:hypothetical protein